MQNDVSFSVTIWKYDRSFLHMSKLYWTIYCFSKKRFNVSPFLSLRHLLFPPSSFKTSKSFFGDDKLILVSLSEYQCKKYLPIYYNTNPLLKMLYSTRGSLFIRVQMYVYQNLLYLYTHVTIKNPFLEGFMFITNCIFNCFEIW